MSQEKNTALKAGIWYTISNFFIKGLAFITMPIFTRIMTKQDIGAFSNITSWLSILSIVTTFEIYSSISIARFDYKKELDSYISSSLVLGTIITTFFYILVLIFNDFFQKIFLIDLETINIIFIYLLVYPAIQMFQIKSRIEYKYIKTIAISLLNAILSTCIAILGVFLFREQLRGRIYGYFIPTIIISISIYAYLLKKGKSLSPKYWKYALRVSFPMIWHLLAGYLLNSSDKIMITKMVSTEANALYSIAYTISLIVSILWQSMNNAWSPWAYEKMDKNDYESLRNNSKPYLIFFIIIVYIMVLITPELLLIAGGEGYLEAKYVMPPVMIGFIFQFVYSLYVNIEYYYKKQADIAKATMIAAILNIILNAIFIPIFGYIAAAYTTLIGYITLLILHYYKVKKLNCDNWYDKRFFVKILILSLMFMIVCNILYTFKSLRFLLIGIIIIFILLFIIKYRKDIISAIKNKSLIEIIEVLKNEKISVHYRR